MKTFEDLQIDYELECYQAVKSCLKLNHIDIDQEQIELMRDILNDLKEEYEPKIEEAEKSEFEHEQNYENDMYKYR